MFSCVVPTGPVQGLVGAREVEVRFGEIRLEGNRLLVLLDGLAVVLFLVELVAVLEGRLGLDQLAADPDHHDGEEGHHQGRVISGSHLAVSRESR